MGDRALTKWQYGKESTNGTAVAATRKFAGQATIPRDRETQFPDDNLGSRSRARRGAVYQIHVDGIRLVTQNFQDLPFLFSCGLKGAITPSEQTASQVDYLWRYNPSLTASNNPDSATLEYGDNVQAYEIEYVMFREYRISGQLGQNAAATVEATGFGKQISPTSLTSLSDDELEDIVANMTEIYIDGSWANLGSTQKTDLLREYDIRILTGVQPKFHGNSKMMTAHAESWIDVMISLIFEGNANADAEWDAWRAGTQRAIRLLVDGAQIGSGVNHKLMVDVFGEYQEIVPIAQEQDGNNLHAVIFHGYQDSSGNMLNVDVITDHNSF